mgnify:CR=1 FL=1
MIFNRINTYIIIEILKNFLLILFIFLSVAWILQITRLIAVSNFLHIEIIEILILSFYLIPNIITVIIPFILIFSALLCFIKLNRDNELISIISLGFGLKPIKNALLISTSFILIFFLFLNFYFAPKVYEIYKNKEYDLRNTLDFDKMLFSNFLNLNKTTILDFEKKNNEYVNIFITFKDEKDNIVYAKKGNIISKNNEYNFQLTNGFKISYDENDQIEKLEFLNYVLKINNNNIKINDKNDKNTLTIFDDYRSRNYLNISFKTTDIILILFVIYFFYINNLKNLNLSTFNNIYFSSTSIFIIIVNQILKNSEINILNYNLILFSLIITSLIITNIKKIYE